MTLGGIFIAGGGNYNVYEAFAGKKRDIWWNYG